MAETKDANWPVMYTSQQSFIKGLIERIEQLEAKQRIPAGFGLAAGPNYIISRYGPGEP